jgi:hydrogenase/urease accessory protein HupE
MKRLIILASLFPAVAWAHPGPHLFDSVTALLAHILSEPDHVAMIAGTVFALGWLVAAVRRSRRNRT